jgi:periplasmic copper chaperone A
MNINRSPGILLSVPESLLAAVLLVCVGAAHAQTPALTVKDAWARPPLAPQNNTAVYMTLENTGTKPKSVVSVSTPDAAKAEIHEMRMQSGMMSMMPVKALTVPANGHVELKPGGFHIMCTGLKKTLKPGDRMNLVLKLDDGTSVPVTAMVKSAEETPNASSAPSGKAMSMPEQQR